ncbi:MAG: choice-of-anchor E domain-containing protein [Tepidisphaeraceae bacterium]|jgi:hypothetical protein
MHRRSIIENAQPSEHVTGLPIPKCKLKLSLLAASVLCVGIAHRAEADSEFFTASVTTPSTPLDWSSSEGLGFTQFDPSLGTLNSVEIALVITNAQGTITDTTPSGDVGHLGEYVSHTTTTVEYDPNAPEVINYFSGATGSYTADPVTTPVPSQQITPTFDLPAGDLALFTGGGTVSLTASTSSQSSWVDLYNETAFDGTTDISESLGGAIEYDYTPASVPEPTTAGLLSMGLFGLLGRRRRSKMAPECAAV